MSVIPFDQRDGVIWFDGKLVPWKDAKIHVLTHGLHYGSCVFEGERAYDGVIYKGTEHSQRFHTMHTAPISALAVSPCGRFAVSGDSSGRAARRCVRAHGPRRRRRRRDDRARDRPRDE